VERERACRHLRSCLCMHRRRRTRKIGDVPLSNTSAEAQAIKPRASCASASHMRTCGRWPARGPRSARAPRPSGRGARLESCSSTYVPMHVGSRACCARPDSILGCVTGAAAAGRRRRLSWPGTAP